MKYLDPAEHWTDDRYETIHIRIMNAKRAIFKATKRIALVRLVGRKKCGFNIERHLADNLFMSKRLMNFMNSHNLW